MARVDGQPLVLKISQHSCFCYKQSSVSNFSPELEVSCLEERGHIQSPTSVEAVYKVTNNASYSSYISCSVPLPADNTFLCHY